jgi:hypothetical protein
MAKKETTPAPAPLPEWASDPVGWLTDRGWVGEHYHHDPESPDTESSTLQSRNVDGAVISQWCCKTPVFLRTAEALATELTREAERRRQEVTERG